MPRKLQLTWQSGSRGRGGRWKKCYRGKAYYFSYGTCKSDAEGYRKALDAWKQKKAEVDAEDAQRPKLNQQEYEQAIEEWTLVLQWSLEHSDEQHVSVAREKINELRARLAQKSPPPITDADRLWSRFRWPRGDLEAVVALLGYEAPVDLNAPGVVVPSSKITKSLDGSPGRIAEEIWMDRLNSERGKLREPDQAIGPNVDSFLAAKKSLVSAGKLSAGRYTPLKLHLYHFRDWLGAETAASAISGKVLSDYHTELIDGISEERWSSDYARDRISAVKGFVRWLYETDVLEDLPKILSNKRALMIGKRLAEPETYTIAEVKKLLAEATARTKLYLLLTLNCGMTQKDISDLKKVEVDWKRGTVTRKRSKTARHANVPTVTYPLWRETFRLLCQEKSELGERVLTNQAGGSLKVEELDGDGELRKIDNVASAFARLKRTTGIKKSLKAFRKTSASLLRSNGRFSTLAELFLGHAPRTVADRHYTQTPKALLDEGILWLGKQYGVT